MSLAARACRMSLVSSGSLPIAKAAHSRKALADPSAARRRPPAASLCRRSRRAGGSRQCRPVMRRLARGLRRRPGDDQGGSAADPWSKPWDSEPLTQRSLELRAALKRLQSGATLPEDAERLRALGASIREQPNAYGFSSVPPDEIEVAPDSYMPQRRDRPLLAKDVSASDNVRLIWAYLVGLLELARSFDTPATSRASCVRRARSARHRRREPWRSSRSLVARR